MKGAGPATDVRERLLAATQALLLRVTPAALVSAIGTRAIAQEAGVSPATLFHHFGSVASLADEVVARVFSAPNLPIDETIARTVDLHTAALPSQVAHDLHVSEFRRLTTDREFRLRMGLWSLGGGTTDGVYGDFLRATDARMRPAVERMIELWGREPRHPFDVRTFQATHVALVNGMTIRHLVDPGLVDEERFALIASSIALVSLRVQGDQQTVADRVAEINYYPLDRVQARRARAAVPAVSATRTALLDAGAELFLTEGYDHVTVAQIARCAGVSPSTFHLHFSTKGGLAIALIHDRARAVEPGGDLAAHLVSLGRFLAEHHGHLAPCVTRLLTRRPVLAGDHLLSSVAAHLGPGPGTRVQDVAQALVGLLAGRIVAAPSEPVTDHVDAVLSLVAPAGLVATRAAQTAAARGAGRSASGQE